MDRPTDEAALTPAARPPAPRVIKIERPGGDFARGYDRRRVSISSSTSSGADSGKPVRRRAPERASRPRTASGARGSSGPPRRPAQSRSGAASRSKGAMLLTPAA
jgi:hypothetical protein